MAEVVEVLVPGGKATAGPPLGPALGPLGINVKAVVDDINKQTADFNGMQVPVTITVLTISCGWQAASAILKIMMTLTQANNLRVFILFSFWGLLGIY